MSRKSLLLAAAPMRRERSYVNVRRAAVFVFLMLAGVLIWSFFALFHKRSGSAGSSLSSDEGSEQLKMKLLELKRTRGGSWDFDLHVVVRRRVPTGPNPIHNRRAVTNRRPPGA